MAPAPKNNDKRVKPAGYRLLIKPRIPPEKTEGGIVLPDAARAAAALATVIAEVVAMGPDAYTDKDRFPEGAWAVTGDWVMIPKFSGKRFRVQQDEYRIINDDEVMALVDNPDDIFPV